MDYDEFSISELSTVEKILSASDGSIYDILSEIRKTLSMKRKEQQDKRPWSNNNERLEHFKDEVCGFLGDNEWHTYKRQSLYNLSIDLIDTGIARYHGMTQKEIFECLKELKKEFEDDEDGTFQDIPIR